MKKFSILKRFKNDSFQALQSFAIGIACFLCSLTTCFGQETQVAPGPNSVKLHCSLIKSWETYYSGGVALDQQGNAYVADGDHKTIDVFIVNGVSRKIGAPDFSPAAVAVDEKGVVYATNDLNGFNDDKGFHEKYYPNGVWVFDQGGKQVAEWGVNEPMALREPAGIAVGTPKGRDEPRVFVADEGNHRICVFNTKGMPLTQWGGLGTEGNGTFLHPHSIALGPDGLVYVLDVGTKLLQVFTSEGKFLRQWNVSQDVEFYEMTFITVDPDNTIYVTGDFTDKDNGYVMDGIIALFSTQGKFLGTIKLKSFQYVTGITVTKNNWLLASVSPPRLSLFSPFSSTPAQKFPPIGTPTTDLILTLDKTLKPVVNPTPQGDSTDEHSSSDARIDTVSRNDLTSDGTAVQIDTVVDSNDDLDELVFHHGGKIVSEFKVGGRLEKLDFMNLRKDGKTQVFTDIHRMSDGDSVELYEWDGKGFSQILNCGLFYHYEFEDLDGDGDQEFIGLERYEFEGPQIYSFDYSQNKYIFSTYEYPEYLRKYAEGLVEGQEDEKKEITKAFEEPNSGYETCRGQNILQIYYMLGDFKKLREEIRFFYDEFPRPPKPAWNTLPTEQEEAQKYLIWYNDPKNHNLGSNHIDFLKHPENSALSRFCDQHDYVKEYRIRLGLRELSQKHIDNAKAFYLQRKYDQAIDEYQQALKIDVDNWEAYGLMGYSYLRDHQIEKAVVQLEESVNTNPCYAIGHYNLALAYWANGQKDKAIEQVKLTVQVDKSFKNKILQDTQFTAFKSEKEFKKIFESNKL